MMHLKLPNYSSKFIDAYIKFMISKYINKKIPRININQYDKEFKNCFGCNSKNKKLIRNLIIEYYFEEDYFKEIIKELKKEGMTILWIHHNLTQVKELADTVTCIKKRVIFSGDPKEELKEDKIMRIFE